MTWPTGDVYDGEWKDDERYGRGVMTFANGPLSGCKYDGEWKDDERHGRGVMTWVNGDIYKGVWKCGEFQ